MNLNTKQEILEVLTMPEETFWSQVAPAAREVCQKQFGTSLLVTAMLAYTNICKNQCLYCGMRGTRFPAIACLQKRFFPWHNGPGRTAWGVCSCWPGKTRTMASRSF